MKKATFHVLSSLQLLIGFLILVPSSLHSQSPLGIPYQAVIRDNAGAPLVNASVTIRFTLHQNTIDGPVEFQETQNLSTNAFGVINAQFGKGTATQGSFGNIVWSNTTKFIQIEANEGSGFLDMGTQQMMSVPYAMYAEQSGTPGPQGPAGPQGPQGPAGTGAGFTHWVGESFGGGVVFHVFKDALGEEHGLICSLTYLSTGAPWGLLGTDVLNCESSWNGAANTAAIMAAGVEAGSAAQLCDAYENGGFTDWYLPAIDELNLMYNVKCSLNRSLSQISGAAPFEFYTLPQKYYCSSSEAVSYSAWNFSFLSGDAHYGNGNSGKSGSFYVRAVRAF